MYSKADAACCWYGVPPAEAADTTTIPMPFQGHFALEGRFFTPDKVDVLEASLKEATSPTRSTATRRMHAFGNETGAAYNADAANLAWSGAPSVLAKYLK